MEKILTNLNNLNIEVTPFFDFSLDTTEHMDIQDDLATKLESEFPGSDIESVKKEVEPNSAIGYIRAKIFFNFEDAAETHNNIMSNLKNFCVINGMKIPFINKKVKIKVNNTSSDENFIILIESDRYKKIFGKKNGKTVLLNTISEDYHIIAALSQETYQDQEYYKEILNLDKKVKVVIENSFESEIGLFGNVNFTIIQLKKQVELNGKKFMSTTSKNITIVFEQENNMVVKLNKRESNEFSNTIGHLNVIYSSISPSWVGKKFENNKNFFADMDMISNYALFNISFTADDVEAAKKAREVKEKNSKTKKSKNNFKKGHSNKPFEKLFKDQEEAAAEQPPLVEEIVEEEEIPESVEEPQD